MREKFQQEGWLNITHERLLLRDEQLIATQLLPLPLRSQTNSKGIFTNLLTNIVTHIMEETNANINAEQKPLGRNTRLVTESEVLKFIGMIIECCATQKQHFKPYLLSKERVGLKKARYNLLRKYLGFNLEFIITNFNWNLKKRLQVSEKMNI